MSPIHTRRALVASLCIAPLAVTAQPSTSPVQKLDDIVVTASRSPQALRDVVGDVTVVDQQTLQRSGKDSLAEILSRQPGVQFSSYGGPQTITSIFMRGTNSTDTLVLIDGMRVNGSTSGSVQFPAIDPSMIERIEILRGAASSLYGSDAIGGVINIITKKGEQDRPLSAWANIGYGTYETAKSSMGLSGAKNGWDYSFSTSAGSSKGFDSQRSITGNNAPNPSYYADKDGYRQHAVSGTLGYRWAPGHHIGLTAYNGYIDGDYDTADFDVFPTKVLRNVHAIARQQAYGFTSTDQISTGWESVSRFGFSRDSYDDRADEKQSTFNSLKRDFSWQNNFALHPDHRLSILMEHLEERVQSTTAFDRTARNTNSAALIYTGRINALHTQASIRQDSITSYNSQTTGSLGLDVDLNDAWQVGMAGSTGFRAPSLNDLYFSAAWGHGNPNLKPEKSRNIEAHIRYDQGDTRASAVVYQNKISNLIAWNFTAFPMFPESIDRATIRGLTLTGEHDFGNTTVRASADFLDPRNDNPVEGATGSQLALRARQVFHLSAEHHIQALKLGAEYQYTGQRYAGSTNDVVLGGFSLFNLTAAYEINKNLGVQVRWNNVLDKDYVLVDGYNTPGSNVFVNLSWRM